MTISEEKAPRPGRPDFQPGYGIKPADQGRLIEWAAVETRLAEARNYWLITASPAGRPHAAPLWGLWHDGSFFFSTDTQSRKAENIDRNNSVVVHLESGDEVVILEGTAQRATDNAALESLDAAYRRKYGFPFIGNPIYRVDVKVAFAWSESDFVESATRWRFGE
jgi:hypothetical protein